MGGALTNKNVIVSVTTRSNLATGQVLYEGEKYLLVKEQDDTVVALPWYTITKIEIVKNDN